MIQNLPQVVIKKKQIKNEIFPDLVCNVEKDISRLMDQGKDYPGTLGEYMERNISAVNMVDTAYTYANSAICYILAYIIHSGFISGYQNRYGDNLKPPTNVYHRMTA
jgi:hypothetical protein